MKKTASIFKNSQEKIKFYKDCYATKEVMESNIFNKIQEFGETAYDPSMFCRYLAMSRALHLMYQHLHWITAGDSFYSDHLLYQKLYKKMTREIDEVAEKFVGLTGSDSACPIKTTRVCSELLSSFYKNFDTNSNANMLSAYALYLEIIFLELNNEFYKKLKEKEISLGLDDMIMSIHNSHEENVYLLKQKFKIQNIPTGEI